MPSVMWLSENKLAMFHIRVSGILPERLSLTLTVALFITWSNCGILKEYDTFLNIGSSSDSAFST
jgi:hypothetical protein